MMILPSILTAEIQRAQNMLLEVPKHMPREHKILAINQVSRLGQGLDLFEQDGSRRRRQSIILNS